MEISLTSKNQPFPPPPNASDSLNGLKFGQIIYFEDVGIAPPAKSGGGSSSPQVPVKRGRSAAVPGGGRPRCQVEGCGVDLSEAKAYYGRHKVCGVHSKAPSVVVSGIEQRFCQQCSRFHQLAEFDQGKRSCRRRLAGHNERRRKLPPGPLFSSLYGHLSSSVYENGKGEGFLLDFSKYPKLTERDTWQPTRTLTHTWHGSANPPPNPFLQGSSSGTHCAVGPTIPSRDHARSLLSNNIWGPLNEPSGPFVSVEEAQMVQSTIATTQFSSVPWGFKGHDNSAGSHEAPHQLGFSGFTQPTDNPYSSFGHSRAFDSSSQYMKWSL